MLLLLCYLFVFLFLTAVISVLPFGVIKNNNNARLTIADTVENLWKTCETDLVPVLVVRETKQKFKKRFQQALSSHHFWLN